MTYQKLVESNNTYCKISKSTQDISAKCIEPFYTPYISKSMVYGSQISFIEKGNILAAFAYGDTYTEFDFQNKFVNEILKNDEIIHIGGGLDEYRATRLLVGNQYSLNDMSTILYIVKDAKEQHITNSFSQGDVFNKLIAHFENLDMQKAIITFTVLQNLYQLCIDSNRPTILSFRKYVTEYFEKECILQPITPQHNKENFYELDR